MFSSTLASLCGFGIVPCLAAKSLCSVALFGSIKAIAAARTCQSVGEMFPNIAMQQTLYSALYNNRKDHLVLQEY